MAQSKGLVGQRIVTLDIEVPQLLKVRDDLGGLAREDEAVVAVVVARRDECEGGKVREQTRREGGGEYKQRHLDLKMETASRAERLSLSGEEGENHWHWIAGVVNGDVTEKDGLGDLVDATVDEGGLPLLERVLHRKDANVEGEGRGVDAGDELVGEGEEASRL